MLYRRARACPSPCFGYASAHPLCRARAPALDPFGSRRSRTTVSGARERSRGTGPRATICKAVSLYRRARACPSPCLGREGNGWAACVFRADRTIAVKKRAVYRRARACPSPGLDRGNGFGSRAFFAQVGRSRGTGPRATVDEAAFLYRRARACPSPGLGRGNGFGWRAFFAQVGRSR